MHLKYNEAVGPVEKSDAGGRLRAFCRNVTKSFLLSYYQSYQDKILGIEMDSSGNWKDFPNEDILNAFKQTSIDMAEGIGDK